MYIYITGYTELTSMYQFGSMEKMKVQPARRNLINSLRAIRQSKVVKKYEDYWKCYWWVFKNIWYCKKLIRLRDTPKFRKN